MVLIATNTHGSLQRSMAPQRMNWKTYTSTRLMTNNQLMKIFHSLPLFRPGNPITKILRSKIFHPPTKILRPRIFHPSTKILRPKIYHPPTALHLLTKTLRSTNLPILCLPLLNCRQHHLFPLIHRSLTLKALLPQLNPLNRHLAVQLPVSPNHLSPVPENQLHLLLSPENKL